MNLYEILNLVVGGLTLCVLCWHFTVLRAYAGDTNTLARVAVEDLPRPCVVLQETSDSSDSSVLEGHTACVPAHLGFVNIGSAPAVNCQYSVRAAGDTQVPTYQLPVLLPARVFDSLNSVEALPPHCVVIIEYESVAGSRYRTQQTLEDRRRLTKSAFHRC